MTDVNRMPPDFVGEAPAPVVGEAIPLPARARETFATMHAECALALAKRESFLRGVMAVLGVPASGYSFDLVSLTFRPVAAGGPPTAGDNGAARFG